MRNLTVILLFVPMVACGSKVKTSPEAQQTWREFRRMPAQALPQGQLPNPETLKMPDGYKMGDLARACGGGEFNNLGQFRTVAGKILGQEFGKKIEYAGEQIMNFQAPKSVQSTGNTKYSNGRGSFGYFLRMTRQPYVMNAARDLYLSAEIITLIPLELGDNTDAREAVLVQYTVNGKPICRFGGLQPSADKWQKTVQDQTDRVNYGTLMIADLKLKEKALPLFKAMTTGAKPTLTKAQFENIKKVIKDPTSSISLFPADASSGNVPDLEAQANAVQKVLSKLIGQKAFFDGNLAFSHAAEKEGFVTFQAMGLKMRVDRVNLEMKRPPVQDNPDTDEAH